MNMDSKALNYVKTFVAAHSGDCINQMARELAGKGDAALEAACDTLREALRGEGFSESMAFGLAAGFACMVRERMAVKH
jgi:hypothetical protein